MKHFTRNFLLALGIAIPLWFRQYQVEQNLEARCRAHEAELNRFSSEVESHLEEAQHWGEGLVKQIDKAFSPGGARS